MILAAVFVLVCIALSIGLTYKVAVEPMREQIASLQGAVSQVKLIAGPKGDTPKLGVDYFVNDGESPECLKEVNQCRGQDGENGKDSVSTKEIIIKEVQETEPYKDIAFNSETGNLESKLSTDTLWEVLIPCDRINTCPEVTKLVEPLPKLGEL